MARDIAQRFNHLFGKGRDFFVLPETVIAEDVATLPGLDGRKMSKSYNNTVPLFEGGFKALKSAVAKIVTDSRGPGEPKDADASHLYLIYKAFASPEESAAFRDELTGGIGWGDAKQRLCQRIEQEMGPLRAHYEDLMAHPDRIEEILQEGARKARVIAKPFMQEIRQAVGLRTFSVNPQGKSGQSVKATGKAARYVSFRDEGGQFRFRLMSAEGVELFCSVPFADPKQAGATMRGLQQQQADAVVKRVGDTGFEIVLEGQKVADGVVSASGSARDVVLESLHTAMQPELKS
jgi:tryptophanyl-tRNA synthetase